MKTIRQNSQGLEVKHWQAFLKQQNLLTDEPNGIFNEATQLATVTFQSMNNLEADGIVGNMTVGTAVSKFGFNDIFNLDFPRKPSFRPMLSIADRVNNFGKFDFIAKPIPSNKENIEILGDWEDNNIENIEIPQLIRLKGDAKVQFHKLAADKVIKLFDDWERAGLMDRILTWEGSYVPRFIRGSTSVLSNHAFGSAFDINATWNGLNAVPAAMGSKGCVRELVTIANEHGFFWGGHFSAPRQDGMHFELAVIDGAVTTRDILDMGLDFEEDFIPEGQDEY